LWEIRYGDVAFFREVADLTDVSATGTDVRVGVVALRDGQLIRFDGEGWSEIPFDEGAVSQMSVADSVLWASVGTEIYRRDRLEQWEHLDTGTWPFPIDVLRGYAAGGAWVVKGGQLCHVGHRETLRVSGVRPHERLPEGSALSFQVSTDSAMGSALSASLDGQALSVNGSTGSWSASTPGLSAGWHSLALAVASPEGAVRRTVEFLVEGDSGGPPTPLPDPTVFWETDIRPIYDASCAVCHGEDGNQTFLGSYETLSALGQLALDLASRGEMPPPTAAGLVPPLSAADIALFETWVQEGMAP